MALTSPDWRLRRSGIINIGFRNDNNIEIEIHHKPAHGVVFRNRTYQNLLLKEIEKVTLTPEGFYTPSIRFALLMQIAHLQQHICDGLGLRQYMDYYILLTHSTKADREYVWRYIKKFALVHVCAAVMGLLEIVFGLSRELMLCLPDNKRGKRLYYLAISGGNFGKFAPKNEKITTGFVLKRWFYKRLRALQWFSFDPFNTIVRELLYWKLTISYMPERIRRRKIFL